MTVWIVLLLLVLLLFGFGFTMHLLWLAAALVLIVWFVAFGRRTHRGSGFRYRRGHGHR
ncbi:hydrophobic protein [Streptomyces syringium]|uniref:hydrophobic protein n=1 Tax=Streptomyces syringium TaxID=76729 RepID=UPI0033A1E2E0